MTLCPTCLSTNTVSAVLNYTHILAAHGFTQPVHINCSIQKQNWERHVGLWMERGACLLKFMYRSAWFPKPHTGTFSHRQLHHCLWEREELGQNCSTLWFPAGHSSSDMRGINPGTWPVGFWCLKTQNKNKTKSIYIELLSYRTTVLTVTTRVCV